MQKQTLAVFDLFQRFREYSIDCSKGWHFYAYDYVIEVNNEFNKFIWSHNVSHQTFMRIVKNPLCSLQEGVFYKTVMLSYVAWILPDVHLIGKYNLIANQPYLSKKVAIYDLTRTFEGEPVCLNFNKTKSVVLKAFELFLSSKYGFKIKPLLEKKPTKKFIKNMLKNVETYQFPIREYALLQKY